MARKQPRQRPIPGHQDNAREIQKLGLQTVIEFWPMEPAAPVLWELRDGATLVAEGQSLTVAAAEVCMLEKARQLRGLPFTG
jgi:hypothetical protein